MPLYACTQCHTVENTALGDYWESQMQAYKAHIEHKPLCSECATGTWHGRFPKERAGNGNWEADPRSGGKYLQRKSACA